MIDIFAVALSYYSLKKSDLVELVELFGSAEKVLSSSFGEMVDRYKLSERTANKLLTKRDEYIALAEQNIAMLKDFQVECLTYSSDEYPTLLAATNDAPLALYSLGDMELTNTTNKWFTITGTKSSSDCGMLTTSKLIEDIAKFDKDITIVAGVSDGIEKLAHRAAIRAGLRSVAVIPYALDRVQTEVIRSLMSEVLKNGGAVLSEYPMGTNFFPNHYKECNRIAAGLSHATILIEAPYDSNTLTTVGYADSYSRDVFAYPGRAIDVSYAGCNAVIKSGKAEMITSFNDIVNIMELSSSATEEVRAPIRLSGDMAKIYDVLSDGTPHSDEEIMERSGITPQIFNSLISLMELDDLVVALKGRMFVRKL